MKPEIIVSSHDLDRLEGLLATPAARNRADLDGLRAELDRAEIREPSDMPADVVTMNSRFRIRELPSGRHTESGISVFTPAGSALLGLSAGQVIDWPTVEGHEVHLEVIKVVAQPSPETA